MKITNKTTDQQDIKICNYKNDDHVAIIPVGAGVFSVASGKTHTWEPIPGEGQTNYHVKVFHAEFIDKLLCEAYNVGVNVNVVVQGGQGDYKMVIVPVT